MRVVLIQPRSSWGKRPYLPNGLLSVAARLSQKGVRVRIVDLNIEDLDDAYVKVLLVNADMIGIGVLGSPYIPQALEIAQTLRQKGLMQPIVFGGETILRLSSQYFARIFSERVSGDVRQISDEATLGEVFGVGALPSMFDVSMRSAIEVLPTLYRQTYFEQAWCLFTSQGCKFRCNFCAASKGTPERFRHPDAFADEVEGLARQVREICGDVAPYEVYLSTLDGCQSPVSMEITLRLIAEIQRRQGVRFPLRFLATSKMTVRGVASDPELLKRWRAYGVHCIGLGVDGDDPAVWRRERKGHNVRSEIDQAFRLISEAGIQPEALMVIGFPGDDNKAILRAVRACFRFAGQGICPRPYLGKSGAPGSAEWTKGGPTVEELLEHPRFFREWENAGLGSRVTHPDATQRHLANAGFLLTTLALKLSRVGCPTQPLFPVTVSFQVLF